MAQLEYNGHKFKFQNTDRFEQSFVRDPSGTDHLFTKFVITVSSLITDEESFVQGGETVEQAAQRIRKKLSVPRKALKLLNGEDKPLLDIPDGDDSNGPQPEILSINRVSQATVLIQFRVTAHKRYGCDESTTYAPPEYLSNRWTETNSYADNWLCTRTRTGVLILSSAVADKDSLRGVITPEVPKGFKRVHSDYQLTADGLNVRYTFTDREQMVVAPAPATSLSITHGLNVTNGAMMVGSLNITLRGPKGADPVDMLARLVRIALSRVRATGSVTDGRGRPTFDNVSIVQQLSESDNVMSGTFAWKLNPSAIRVEGPGLLDKGAAIVGAPVPFFGAIAAESLRAMYANGANPPPAAPVAAPNKDGKDTAGFGMTLAWVGAELPGVNPDRGIAPPVRGTADYVKLIAAALGDPCGSTATLSADAPTTENTLTGTSGGTGGTVTASVTKELATGETDVGTDVTPGVYQTVVVRNTYRGDTGRRVLASTKEGEKPKAIRLHNEVMKLTCEYSVSRIGGPPVIPDPKDCPKHYVLETATMTHDNVELAADGVSLVYTVAGVNVYGCLEPVRSPLIAPFSPLLDYELAGKTEESTSLRSWVLTFPKSPLFQSNPFFSPAPEPSKVQENGPSAPVSELTTGGPVYTGPGGQVGA